MTAQHFLADPPRRPTRETFRLELDLSKRHATYEHGALTVILTWLPHNKQPALVLIRTDHLANINRIDRDRVIPCVVPLSMAYVWDETTGDGRHCARSSIMFAENLGMDVTPRVLFKLTDLIREHLGDLILCPPQPDWDQVEVAFGKHVDPITGKVIETGITEDV